MAVSLVTPICRLSYPHLVQARVAPGSTDAKFGAMLIIEPNEADIRAILAKIVEAASERWPAPEAKLKSGALHNPLRHGDSRPDDPNVEGMYFLSANSKERPELVDRDRSPVLTDVNTLFYPGAYVRAVIAFAPFDVNMKKGVGCYLNGLQFVRHGTRIDGRKPAARMFDDGADLGDEGDYDDGAGADAPARPRGSGPRPGAQGLPW